MILNEAASQSQSPIVVAPSDESSQSTSGLDSLVPGRVLSEFLLPPMYRQTNKFNQIDHLFGYGFDGHDTK